MQTLHDRRRTMARFLVCSCVLLTFRTPAASELRNPGFEEIDPHGGPACWKVRGRRAAAAVESRPFWQRLTRAFNTGKYTRLRVYLRLQFDTGTVRFDAVRLSGIPLKNPGFEQADGNRFPGWGQDNAGRTIFRDMSGAAFSGKTCLRISQKDRKGMSRVWQDIPCKPGQDLTFSVWARGDRSMNAYAEVYGMETDGKHGPFWSTRRFRVQDDGTGPFGRHALALRADKGGRIEVSQKLTSKLRGRAVFEASVMFVDLAAGVLRLQVADAHTGQLLAAVPAGTPERRGAGWERCRVDFRMPEHGDVEVAVVGHGPIGLVRIDNVRLRNWTPPFPVRRFEQQVGAPDLVWQSGAPPQATGLPDTRSVRRAWELLCETLHAAPDAAPQGPPVEIVLQKPAPNPAWPATERYRLQVTADGVRIEAFGPDGVRWALMTLLGLGASDARAWHATACRIDDWPDLPLRASYVAGLPFDPERRAALCRRLVRLKMNALVIEDSAWFTLGNADVRKRVRAVCRDIRDWGIEPIPELQSFGHAGQQIVRDPRVAEGKWVRGEHLQLHGMDPVPLAQHNVIRTSATDVVLTSVDGKTVYALGKDYAVVDGTIEYRHADKAVPFAVRRLPGSRIPGGAAVVASYDVVGGGGSYCPSEPAVYRICLPALQAAIRLVHPRYVHIGHDEPTRMNGDSRCRRRDLSETALIAEDLTRWNAAAHEVDPRVRLMMWADPLNPFHNGRRVLRDDADFGNIPKDIIQCVWFYGPSDPLSKGWSSLEFFAKQGITTTGSPWYNRTCAENWGRVARKALDRDLPFLGIIYTSWHRRWDALDATAAAAWKAGR
ncbi:MAG: hypothetical protein GXP31_12525 [Kiritimatiellaeota bacterium]|nr:hypothetical protein [Kiritimatiellota bacterium]